MAINIKRYNTYILEKSGEYLPEEGRWTDTFYYGENKIKRFIRIAIEDKVSWHNITPKGYLGEVSHYNDQLEKLFQESNGFLEQLELF